MLCPGNGRTQHAHARLIKHESPQLPRKHMSSGVLNVSPRPTRPGYPPRAPYSNVPAPLQCHRQHHEPEGDRRRHAMPARGVGPEALVPRLVREHSLSRDPWPSVL